MKSMWDWYGLDWKLVVALAAIGWLAPKLGGGWFARIETVLSRLAGHRRLALIALFILPIAIRLSLLHRIPLQPPYIHDEFSYLLAADTFAHGHLANPPHPMWTFFDTFHVLQQPTYASKYPPAQGAVLAVGQLLGSPWIGVLLSMGAMCAAFLWMLQGWVPARWALLGSILVMMRFAFRGYWIDSYWGGAVAAVGGALVMGALPRILRKQRARDAFLLVLGAGILANSRPLEGCILCVPVAIFILYRLLKERGPSLRRLLLRAVLPAAAGLVAVLSFTLYYNWRVTADPLLFPHVLFFKTHSTVPMLIWQDLETPPRTYANPQFQHYYNDWERAAIPRNWEERESLSSTKVRWIYNFFIGPALLVPLAALWSVFRNPRTRFLVLQFLFCLVGLLVVIWFQPHYVAPLMATIFIIVMQSFRYLRTWQFKGRAVGIGLSRAAVIGALAIPLMPFYMHTALGQSPFPEPPANWNRLHVAQKLEATPGNHLVIVRYGTLHSIHEEWVYNDADIDHAKIVWAREIPGVSLQPLLDYFKDRNVWLVEPDSGLVTAKQYVEMAARNPSE